MSAAKFKIGGEITTLAHYITTLVPGVHLQVLDQFNLQVRTYDGTNAADAIAACFVYVDLTTVVNAAKNFGEWTWHARDMEFLSDVSARFDAPRLHTPQSAVGVFLSSRITRPDCVIVVTDAGGFAAAVGATSDYEIDADWSGGTNVAIEPAKPPRLPFE